MDQQKQIAVRASAKPADKTAANPAYQKRQPHISPSGHHVVKRSKNLGGRLPGAVKR